MFDVDPADRTIVVCTRAGERTLTESDAFSDPLVPWLAFGVRDAFARLELFGF